MQYGYVNEGKIISCYNKGNVSGLENYIGGITGEGYRIKNSYNVGNVIGENSNYIGSISGSGRNAELTDKNYFLENTVNGENGYIISGTEVKTSNEMREIYLLLGQPFKKDTNNINNGYPILNWQ